MHYVGFVVTRLICIVYNTTFNSEFEAERLHYSIFVRLRKIQYELKMIHLKYLSNINKHTCTLQSNTHQMHNIVVAMLEKKHTITFFFLY
jgi:hypothetical protein